MDNKVVIRPNFLITTFLRPNMPIEVEIGRNYKGLTETVRMQNPAILFCSFSHLY